MFWRVIRGMLPHKTARGKAALERLKVFEGIPFPYDGKKRMVVPQALKVLRLKSYRRSCEVGELMSMCGWRRSEIVEKLEEKRKTKSALYYANKQKKIAKKAKQMNDGKLGKINNELKKYGF